MLSQWTSINRAYKSNISHVPNNIKLIYDTSNTLLVLSNIVSHRLYGRIYCVGIPANKWRYYDLINYLIYRIYQGCDAEIYHVGNWGAYFAALFLETHSLLTTQMYEQYFCHIQAS